MNRNNFIKKLCFSTACVCSMGAASAAETSSQNQIAQTTTNDTQTALVQNWTANLLNNIAGKVDNNTLKKALKQNAMLHFEHLKMDSLLTNYIGKLPEFLSFLEKEWGWIVDHDNNSNTILVNENKDKCVCPIISKTDKNNDIMCNCSEGFNEKMFEVVTISKTQAKVVSSIIRGDKTCIYEVKYNL